MSRKFLTPIDLTGLEILNVRFQNLATAPTPKGKGHVYYNTVDDTVYTYDGVNWQASGKIIAGTLASRPAAGSSGRLYFATDATEKVLYYDNGTAWTKVGESKKYIDDEISTAVSNHNVSSGVHGVTGSVVGTSDTQTLSNKTISDNLHFNDGSDAGYIAANAGDLKIDANNTLAVTADDNITLTTNNGNIVLNPDGNAYITSSADPNNRIATIGDLNSDAVVQSVSGTTGEVDATTDGSGNVTVGLPNIVQLHTGLIVGEDPVAETNQNGELTVKKADGSNSFDVDSTGTTINGTLDIQDGNGNPKLSVTHSYTGTTRITTGDDLALRSNDGDIILYPGNDNGGTGRAYVHWGNDSTGAGLGNEILTRDANQVITNKTVNDELLFTNPSTAGEDGGIYVDDTSEEFVVKAYNSNLIAEATGANADVILNAPNGDIYKTTNSSDDNILVTRGDSVTLTNKTLGSGTVLSADIDADDFKIVNLADPQNPQDAANKRYVDAATAGLSWKQAVNLLYDAAIPVMSGSGATQLVIDGHTVLGDADSGYRILITQSSNAGIWVYNSTGGTWELTRAADADTFEELKGAAVFVMEGSLYGSTSWVQSDHYITGFAGQDWVQFSGQGTYTAGDGLELNGSEFTVKLDSDSLAKSANGLSVHLNGGGAIGNDDGLYVNTGTGLSINGSNQLVIDTAVVARKFSETVGNGTLTSFVLTHALNTRDVTVTVYDTASYAEVFADVAHSTVDTVTVSFAEAPTTNQYRVVIVG